MLWLVVHTAEASRVVWTGLHDIRCGYPQHNCGTSAGHVYLNIHWAGITLGDIYYIYNDRGELMAQQAIGSPSGTAVIDRGSYTMCDCLPGTYEVLDLIAVRAAGYNFGRVLPASGGEILNGVVMPGMNCTEGCPGGPTNEIYVDIYLGTAIPSTHVKPCDSKEGGDQCKSCAGGMARYSVHSMLASLNIEDTPVGYSPPRGPAVNFTVTYNQRDADLPPSATFSNLGSKWSFNWLSYVTDNPRTQLASLPAAFLTVPGGGTEKYLFDSGTQTFSRDPQSHAILVRIPPGTSTPDGSYERQLPDGSKQVFAQSDSATSYPRKFFMTQWIDPSGNAVTIQYLPNSTKIDKIIDGVGNPPTQFYYEDANNPYRITKVTDPFNRSAILGYTNGQLTSITDPVGIVSQFHYVPGTDFIDSLTTPYGTTTFTTGESGTNRWIEITDPEGGKERVEYRDNAPGISATEASVPTGFASANTALNVANSFYWSKKAMQLYPPVNGVPDYTKAKISHWLYNSDGTVSGILGSEKAPLENRVWHSYEGQVDQTHVGTHANPIKTARVLDDGTTQLWQYEYNNALAKMTKSTDPGSRVTSYDYDPDNNIDLLMVRQTTGSNNELLRTMTYSQHKVVTDKDAAGKTTIYEYNGFGQITKVKNARNEETSYVYGPATGVPTGYLSSVSSPTYNGVSAETKFTYDSANRVRTVTNVPDNYTVTTDYDNLDRPITVAYPDGTTQQSEYKQDFGQADPGKNILDLTKTIDRRGRQTVRHYNRNRQLDSLTEPFGSNSTRTTSYEWCTCGSLTGITDPRGKITKFDHDLQRRVISKTFGYGTPSATTVSYAYENTTSRLKSMTDAKSQRTNYQYWLDDTLQQISYTNIAGQPLSPPTPSVSFTYDTNYNRVATMVDGTGTTSYSYYQITTTPPLGAGQLQTVDGPLANDVITYGYDELGRITSQSINGVSSSVAYDSLGRLSTSDNPLGHFGRTYESDVTSRLKTLTSPTGQTANYTYFDNLRDRRLQTLQDLTSTTANISKFDYTYDAEGQIYPTWIKQLTTSPGITSNLTYDSGDQLTGVTNTTPGNPSTTFAYGYDTAGNRTSDSTATYTISDVNQITNTGYTYDANGNLTADGVNTYVWDAANRLTGIVYPASAGRSDFTYDGLGRRVKLLEKNGSGLVQKTSNFIWSGMTIAEERDSTNTVIKRFLPEGVQLPTGITPNNKLYYSKDHLGSVRSLTNANGTILDTLDYDAYGGISRAPVPANDTSGAGPVLTVAASRMTHGSSGTFDVNLPLSAAPGIEMRSGPSYTVLLTFDRTVLSATSVTVSSGVGSVASTTFSGNTATVSLSGVSDRQTITLELDNVVGVVGVNTKVLVSMSVLVGDVNQSGAVTIEDIALVTANTGMALTGSTFKYDINHNGLINSTDITQIKVLGSQGSSLYPDFAFTGHFYHARSGLYLAPYRAYNPAIGRWLSRDPIGERDNLNLYSYVANDPIDSWDPDGLEIAAAGSGVPTRGSGFSRHGSYLTFTISCPVGRKVANVVVHYDQLAGVLETSIDPSSPTPRSIDGINCSGMSVTVTTWMRTRYASYIWGSYRNVQAYVNYTFLSFDCVCCQ